MYVCIYVCISICVCSCVCKKCYVLRESVVCIKTDFLMFKNDYIHDPLHVFVFLQACGKCHDILVTEFIVVCGSMWGCMKAPCLHHAEWITWRTWCCSLFHCLRHG